MLTLPDAIVSILAPFATLFTNPTWRKAQLLLVDAILTPGQRDAGPPRTTAGAKGRKWQSLGQTLPLGITFTKPKRKLLPTAEAPQES